MKITVFLAALCAVLLASNAEARPKHHHRHHVVDATNMVGCSDQVMRPCNDREKYSRKHSKRRDLLGFSHTRAMPPGLRRVMAEGAGRVVGGRPRGCPRRYCGCGASLYVFGRIIPRLNLAANWLRFPRAAPAPGMVAARRGHVFVLKRHIRGKIWMVHDSNSGHGKTRVHPRSIAGWAIVDPRAGS